ncbi:MAG: hypothetical protein Q9214_006576, partial [Letrouitia sp. 1 TL-2023]
ITMNALPAARPTGIVIEHQGHRLEAMSTVVIGLPLHDEVGRRHHMPQIHMPQQPESTGHEVAHQDADREVQLRETEDMMQAGIVENQNHRLTAMTLVEITTRDRRLDNVDILGLARLLLSEENHRPMNVDLALHTEEDKRDCLLHLVKDMRGGVIHQERIPGTHRKRAATVLLSESVLGLPYGALSKSLASLRQSHLMDPPTKFDLREGQYILGIIPLIMRILVTHLPISLIATERGHLVEQDLHLRADPRLPYARDDYRNTTTSASYSENPKKAPSAPSYRNEDSRPPPSAPPYNDRFARDPLPPSGPPSAPVSMSAHNRPASASVLSAPTRPRGGPSNVGREPPRDGPYGPPRGGGSRGGYHGPSPRHGSYDRPPAPTEGPPAGPRGGGPPPHHADRSGLAQYEHRPPFRTNNSSSTTYPRTQRFTQHLGNVSAVVPGGKVDKSNLDPAAEKRLTELEEGRKKLLEAIEEKQRVKRSGLRDWDRLERESRRDALKSELAERHLESLAGEVGGSGAAF